MRLLVLASIIGAALAAPQNYYNQPQQQYQDQYSRNVVPIVSETNEVNPDGSYSYSYQTGDGQQAQAQGYLKNAGAKDAEAEVAQGSYSYTAPDGTPIQVNWVADENGFRAEGAHIPTPPPIPDAILKSLSILPQSPSTEQQQYQPQYQQNYKQQQYQQQFQPQYQQNRYRF
ncbi:Insect cuticle protein [Popillia japonica]|uniref:Insect cuticle protein n=1 Tax=Popillia japonica TaxID=7064 RepID=A0AAW1KLA7_POPJA